MELDCDGLAGAFVPAGQNLPCALDRVPWLSKQEHEKQEQAKEKQQQLEVSQNLAKRAREQTQEEQEQEASTAPKKKRKKGGEARIEGARGRWQQELARAGAALDNGGTSPNQDQSQHQDRTAKTRALEIGGNAPANQDRSQGRGRTAKTQALEIGGNAPANQNQGRGRGRGRGRGQTPKTPRKAKHSQHSRGRSRSRRRRPDSDEEHGFVVDVDCSPGEAKHQLKKARKILNIRNKKLSKAQRKEKQCAGHTDDETVALDRPIGPRTHKEIFTWPATFVHDLLHRTSGSGCADDLQRNVRQVLITTSYSGMGCPEMTAPMLEHELLQNGVPAAFKHFRAAEIDAKRRAILYRLKPASKPLHVQSNLLDRLPMDVRNSIEAMRKRFLARLTQRRLASAAEIRIFEDTRQHALEKWKDICTRQQTVARNKAVATAQIQVQAQANAEVQTCTTTGTAADTPNIGISIGIGGSAPGPAKENEADKSAGIGSDSALSPTLPNTVLSDTAEANTDIDSDAETLILGQSPQAKDNTNKANQVPGPDTDTEADSCTLEEALDEVRLATELLLKKKSHENKTLASVKDWLSQRFLDRAVKTLEKTTLLSEVFCHTQSGLPHLSFSHGHSKGQFLDRNCRNHLHSLEFTG